jgi:hypothetical protein
MARAGGQTRTPLEIRVRIEHVSGNHGLAVAAAQGDALRELLAALDDAGHPPSENADRARSHTGQGPA